MVPASCSGTAPVPPPAYQRVVARHRSGLHLDALTVVETLHLLALCRLAVGLSQRGCPPALPKGPGGVARTYTDASLLLIALLRALRRISPQDMHDGLAACPPAVARAGRGCPAPAP